MVCGLFYGSPSPPQKKLTVSYRRTARFLATSAYAKLTQRR